MVETLRRSESSPIIHPDMHSRFISEVEQTIDKGYSFIDDFTAADRTNNLKEEIFGVLGTAFRSYTMSYAGIPKEYPLLTQLREEYTDLLKAAFKERPELNRELIRVDILNYHFDENFPFHRDPPSYRPIILGLTLSGSCNVKIKTEKGVIERTLSPGDLWFLRGAGFDKPRLRHYISLPLGGQKRLTVIMNGLLETS